MEDLLEQANDVQETLGRSYAIGDDVDEEDLEAGMILFTKLLELAALGDELDFEEEGEPSYLQEPAMELNLPVTGNSEPQQVCCINLNEGDH
jgi:charged multivesicular body protein 5